MQSLIVIVLTWSRLLLMVLISLLLLVVVQSLAWPQQYLELPDQTWPRYAQMTSLRDCFLNRYEFP